MIDVKITKVTDHPDGTATIEFETDQSTLIFLAKIGMQTLIEVAAGKTLDQYPGTEEAENATNDVSVSQDGNTYGS